MRQTGRERELVVLELRVNVHLRLEGVKVGAHVGQPGVAGEQRVGPAEQVGPAPVQSGHGTSPSIGPVK